MKSTDQGVNLAKSSEQRLVQTGDKHIRGTVLSKPAFIRLFDRIPRTFRDWNQAIKVKFRQSKVLIPIVKRSIGPM